MGYEKEVQALNNCLFGLYTMAEGQSKTLHGLTFEMVNPRPLQKQYENVGILKVYSPEIKDGFQYVTLSAFWITIATRFATIEAFFKAVMEEAGANPNRWRNAYTEPNIGWYYQGWCLRLAGENSDTGLREETQTTYSGKSYKIDCDDVVLKPKTDEPQIDDPGKCWNCGVHV